MNQDDWGGWIGATCLVTVGLLVATSGCSKREQVGASGPLPKVLLERAIVEASESNQNYSPGWDLLIRNLARRYANEQGKSQRDHRVGVLAKRALDRGCRDPFVGYLWFREIEDLNNTDAFIPEATREGLAIATEMRGSSYPIYLRALAQSRAWAMFWRNVSERDGALSQQLLASARQTEYQALSDSTVPEWQARSLALILDGDWKSSKTNRDETFAKIDRALTDHFGDCATLHLLRGKRATTRAWEGRGKGYAYTVTDAGWEIFNRELLTAETELLRAWELDPSEHRIASEMITVCMGLGRPRAEMEKWFRRGVSTNAYDFLLAYRKLYYLAPRWMGSLGEQLSFGRECLTHPEYGDQAALMLWYAHTDYQNINHLPRTYFAQPEVWADINQSFAAYFSRCPEATSKRMDYAYHAWLAKDWDVLRAQLASADPSVTDLNRVGGRAGYDQMVADSKAHLERNSADIGRQVASANDSEVAPEARSRLGPSVDSVRTQRILPLLKLTAFATIGGQQIAILNGQKVRVGEDSYLSINGTSIEIHAISIDRHSVIISLPPDRQQYVLRPGLLAVPLSL